MADTPSGGDTTWIQIALGALAAAGTAVASYFGWEMHDLRAADTKLEERIDVIERDRVRPSDLDVLARALTSQTELIRQMHADNQREMSAIRERGHTNAQALQRIVGRLDVMLPLRPVPIESNGS